MLSVVDRRPRQPVDRSGDRLVAMAGIAGSLVFLAAAIASLALPPATRRGLWLPLHLALAGAASTAIAGVLPFFVAAFAAAPPASTTLRVASLVGVVAGAVGVTIGVVAGLPPVAVGGGVSFVTGIGLVAAAAIIPVRQGLGPSRGIVTRGYVAALAMVAVGGLLATLFVGGWAPLVEHWDRARPAHAWLNLSGFVSVVIASTLIHFFPTVVGARIGAHASGRVTVTALVIAPPVVAFGYVVDADVVVRAGALVALGGAVALVVYAVQVWRTRGHWTTEAGWHRFAIGGLASAIGWFLVGMAILAGRPLALGIDRAASAIEPLIGPFVGGWVALSILASASHLVPAIGPGDQAAHARQRQVLAGWATARLGMLNLGVAGLWLGPVLGRSELTLGGTLSLGLGVGATLALLGAALSIGLRFRRTIARD